MRELLLVFERKKIIAQICNSNKLQLYLNTSLGIWFKKICFISTESYTAFKNPCKNSFQV